MPMLSSVLKRVKRVKGSAFVVKLNTEPNPFDRREPNASVHALDLNLIALVVGTNKASLVG